MKTYIEKQIIFKCNTCLHYNRMEAGTPNFEEKQVLFDSLTDAWKHLSYTNDYHYSNTHEIIAIYEEEQR